MWDPNNRRKPKKSKKMKHKRSKRRYSDRTDRFGFHLDHMTQVLRKSEWYSPRRVSFRPSSFPICPRLVALNELRKSTTPDGEVFQVNKFVSEPYFGVGTVCHEVHQQGLGRIGALYGIWRCPHKKVIHTGDAAGGRVLTETLHCNYSIEQWGTTKCPRCLAEGRVRWLEFEEYNLQPMADHLGLSSAHTDGAMYLGDGSHSYPIPPDSDLRPDAVLELKTTSQDDFDGRTEPKSQSHVEQASAYVELLRALKGWDIKHIVYGYINRNHPWQVKFFRHDPLPPGTVRRNAIRFHLGRRWPKDLPVLPNGLCKSVEDAIGFRWWGMEWMGCPESQTCFGGNGKGGLSAGEIPVWMDLALNKLVQIEEER